MHSECLASILGSVKTLLLVLPMLSTGASISHADVTWTIDVTSSHGNSLDALNPGEQIIIDITARTDDRLIVELDASAAGYDPTLLSFDHAIVSQSILGGFAVAPGWTLSGVDNSISTPVEQLVGSVGQVRFLEGTATQTPTLGDGSGDLSPVDLMPGGPQFRLVFDWIGGVGGTDVEIGTVARFGDSFVGATGARVGNAILSLAVIPEPATALLLGLGLAGLARRH